MDTAPFEDISECQTLDALLRQKIVYLQLLQGVVVAANEALTIAEAMQRCLDQVCAHTGWPIGHAYLPAEDVTGTQAPTTFWHLDAPGRFATFQAIIEETCLTPGVGLLEQVLASGTPAWIRDMTAAPHVPWAKHAADVGVKAGFACPVSVGAKVSAVLEFFSTEAGGPEAALLDVMAHMGTQLGRVIERRRAEETRARLAAILESSDDAIIGTTLDQDNRDRWAYSATGQVGYDLYPGYQPFLRFTYTRTEYDEGIRKPNSDNYEAVVGTTLDLTSLLTGEIFIGYLARNYDETLTLRVSGKPLQLGRPAASKVWVQAPG